MHATLGLTRMLEENVDFPKRMKACIQNTLALQNPLMDMDDGISNESKPLIFIFFVKVLPPCPFMSYSSTYRHLEGLVFCTT